MITAQDIREKTFEKSRIGGYDMASVDNFLEEIADDITAAQKENSVLKSKMKVLVDKIEEYRANEEALNLAVISAQKLAVQIEADARTRAAAMLAVAALTLVACGDDAATTENTDTTTATIETQKTSGSLLHTGSMLMITPINVSTTRTSAPIEPAASLP